MSSGVPEHQTLVACALGIERVTAATDALFQRVINAGCDIRGLLADRDGHAARCAVEALLEES